MLKSLGELLEYFDAQAAPHTHEVRSSECESVRHREYFLKIPSDPSAQARLRTTKLESGHINIRHFSTLVYTT